MTGALALQVTAAVASSQETYVSEISTVDEILAGAQSVGGSNTVPAVPQDTATTVPAKESYLQVPFLPLSSHVTCVQSQFSRFAK